MKAGQGTGLEQPISRSCSLSFRTLIELGHRTLYSIDRICSLV